MMARTIERLLAGALVLLFLATLVTVVWQVLGRYLFAAPSSATEEIARFLLIWLGTLSMAYALARRMHVGVDLVSGHITPAAKSALMRVIWLACAGFSLAVMVYGGGLLVRTTAQLGQASAALGLPMWTIYTIMPLSGLIMAGFALGYVFRIPPEADHGDDAAGEEGQ